MAPEKSVTTWQAALWDRVLLARCHQPHSWRPTAEAVFYEMIHMFVMVVVALGIAIYPVVAKFTDDVAFGAIRMGESWKCAHELLMLYLREIDWDHTRTQCTWLMFSAVEVKTHC